MPNTDEFKEKERIRHKLYRLTHKKQIKTYRKKYYVEHREEEKTYREQHKEEHNKYCREWNKTHKENRKKSGKKYYSENKEKLNQYRREYYIKHPEVIKAHWLAHDNIQTGKYCELCPEDDVHIENLIKHHPDYNYPLITVTCCQSCHLWVHKRSVN